MQWDLHDDVAMMGVRSWHCGLTMLLLLLMMTRSWHCGLTAMTLMNVRSWRCGLTAMMLSRISLMMMGEIL